MRRARKRFELSDMTSKGVLAAQARAAILVALVLCACGGGTPPPGPGTSVGSPPDLRGTRVLVSPTQQVLGVSGDPDAELAFGLRDRTRALTWVLPYQLDEVLARSPGISASPRGLPVRQFLQAEVCRSGDPLYGEFRRMAALVDADPVLSPVQAALSSNVDEDPRVDWSVALMEVSTGRVHWFGIVEGGAFPAGAGLLGRPAGPDVAVVCGSMTTG